MFTKIANWVSAHQEEIEATYQYLHENAEISWEEKNTTTYLCRELEKLGIPYQTFEDQTGVIGLWGNKENGPVNAIRADMDALWQNVRGEWKANHSCGHDAHMTMVLYAIKCLKDIGYNPPGQLKIIFQPAEESGLGAKSIIDKGVIEDVDSMVGIHVRPIQEIITGQATAGIYHGATTLLRGTIQGVQAHGARPHLGINVVDSLAAIINAINSIKLDPTVPYSAKVTIVKAGGQNVNIIPDYAEFGIDLRAQTNEAMNQLIEKAKRAVVSAGEANGATVNVEVGAQMVAAIPDAFMEEIVGEAITEALGETALQAPPITPGGEDFHFYKASYPNIKATVVGLGTNLHPGLHHPEMTFDLSSLQDGVKILSNSMVKLFEKVKVNVKLK